MKIQLKRSNILETGAAKQPTSEQLEYGELAVNYNNDDPAIFLKTSTNQVVRISGYGNISDDGQVELPSDVSPPADPLPGNLWFNADEGRLYIYYDDGNSQQWVDASPDSYEPGLIPDINDPNDQGGTLDDRYVKMTGDTMTGKLETVETEDADTDATVTTKGYVDGFKGYVPSGPTNPSSGMTVGDLFYNTADEELLYWDGSQWARVDTGLAIVSNSNPPTDDIQEGSLWWDSSEGSGNLFVLYSDPQDDGGTVKTWVSAISSGSDGASKTTTTDTPPSQPVDGELWWNTNDNNLYIWYTDVDTGQWVVASPGSGGGGEGGGSQVLVQETRPNPGDYEEGTLWWNSDETGGLLYVLYNDETEGNTWIEASPTVNLDGVVIKEPGGASQNINGNLTLGTDKITLNSTDGSATFAGPVLSEVSSTKYSKVFDGQFRGRHDEGTTASCFLALKGGDDPSTNSVIRMRYDGSAEFTNSVTSGIAINSATEGGTYIGPSGAVVVNRITDSATDRLFWGKVKNNSVFQIYSNGSADFGGKINVGGNVEAWGQKLDLLNFSSYGQIASGQIAIGSSNDTCVSAVNSDKAYNFVIKEDGNDQGHGLAIYANRRGKSDLFRVVRIFGNNGSVTVTGNLTANNVTFNLEPDNPDNYTTTTSVEADPETGEETTVETEVYNGPTLDVKAVIQDLQQRVADRDTVIADLTTRIQNLEGGN